MMDPGSSRPLTCDEVEERALVERYLGGRLPPAEQETFEAHYLTCERCQEALRLAAAIRQTLPQTASQRTHRPRWRTPLYAGLGLAAAAGLAALWLVPRDQGSEEMKRLGTVLEPPIYLGVPVRGVPTSADSLFEAAMADYASRRYDAAARGLSAALSAGVDSVPVLFFRASSLLMVDRAREAAEAYERVTALGDTPYLAEARFYQAKALLRLGRGSEAVAELRTVAERPDELGRWASALADSVEARIRR